METVFAKIIEMLDGFKVMGQLNPEYNNLNDYLCASDESSITIFLSKGHVAINTCSINIRLKLYPKHFDKLEKQIRKFQKLDYDFSVKEGFELSTVILEVNFHYNQSNIDLIIKQISNLLLIYM